jgi:hypothetical protein
MLRVPTGWWYFILSGSPDFRQAEDTYWGAPSLAFITNGGPYVAGIYQVVPVTPGVVYQTDIGWAAPACNFQMCDNMQRRLGLDPTGGTDPQALSVVWSRIEYGADKWPDLTVSARAAGPKMTVFVWVNRPTSYGVDEIYLDAVGLWPDASQPSATNTPESTATPTRRPPTRTAPPATDTPAPTDTPTPLPPTDLPTVAVPTYTPTPTLAPTSTPVPPTATPTPTWTPTTLAVQVARSGQLLEVEEASPLLPAHKQEAGREELLLIVAVGAVVLAGTVGATAVGLYLRASKGKSL